MIERGMTKQQVIAILGKPHEYSFNDWGEAWRYYKPQILTGQEENIVVGFGKDERVRLFQSSLVDYDNNTSDDLGSQTVQPVVPVPMVEPYCEAMDEASFSVLNRKVSDASFDSNKCYLIEVASLGCFYTCRQCAQLLSNFTMSDDKMKALRLMARHIVDPQNASVVCQVFNFTSEKDEAIRIINGNN